MRRFDVGEIIPPNYCNAWRSSQDRRSPSDEHIEEFVTHRPAIHALHVDGRPSTRIVLGDWYEQGSLVRWDRDGPELVSLPRPFGGCIACFYCPSNLRDSPVHSLICHVNQEELTYKGKAQMTRNKYRGSYKSDYR